MARPVVRLSLTLLLALVQASAQQITTTGLTATTLSITGNTGIVTTTTIVGNSAFNSFGNFNVTSGSTIQFVVPQGVTNLINVATNSSSNINGLLTTSDGSEASVHVFLLNPYGCLIGSGGSVVAENITFANPTMEWCRTLFDGTNRPNPEAVATLLAGSTPISDSAYVSVNGSISALESINIHAFRFGAIGSLTASAGPGPVLRPGDIRIESVDNATLSLNSHSARNGSVVIHSGKSVKVQGTVRLTATGNIELQAGDGVYVAKGASVCAGSNVVMQGSNLVQVAEKGNVHAGGSVIMKSANQTVISNAAYVVSQSVEGVSDMIVPLAPGWNLLACNSPLVSPVSNVLAAIAGKYSMVCTHAGGDWRFYDPTNTAGSTLTNFEPGIGYWINVTEATNLTPP